MSQGISSDLNGKFDHKFDAKNRLSIPSEWRPNEGCCLYLLEARKADHPIVKALTREMFDEYVRRIKDSSLTPADKDLLVGKLHADCVETTINGQGKMLVPKRMLDRVGYDAEVKLVGRGGYFEIWKPRLFEQVEELEAKRIKELNADLGIF